jgi:hypothetical protein
MEDILKYYGIDWFGMVATLLAVWFLGNKNRYGFISFIISNLAWIAVGFFAVSHAIVIGNAIFLVINIRGFLKWKKNIYEEINTIENKVDF